MKKMYLLKKWLSCHAEFISASKHEIPKQVRNDIILKRYKKITIKFPLSVILSTVFLTGVYLPYSNAEILKLREKNEDVNQELIKLENGDIVLKNGQILKLNQVREIIFSQNQEKPKAIPAQQVSKEELAKIQELFKTSDEYAKQYPGIDGIGLVDEGEYKLKPDGTYVYRAHFVGHIKKESLKSSWGSVIRGFEEGRNKVKIVKASTYHRDGKVFPLDESKITIAPPQGGELFFTKYMTMNYSLPEVEVDSIIDYIVEEETYNPFRKDFFFPVWGFQSYQPVIYSSVKITIPENETLYYATRNISDNLKQPKITTKDNEKTYYWRMDNIPPLVSEPDMPQYQDITPYLAASVFNDWKRITSWLKKMHQERIIPGTDLQKFTLDLVKDCKTTDEKVAKIYHYIQQKIRYIAIKMGVASGWGGYDANETWKKQYGCCIDKALLLSAMLKVIGVDSSTILINTNSSADTMFEIPTVYFEHAISLVKFNGKRMFLDPVGSDSRYPSFLSMDQGVKCLNVFDEKIDETPFVAPEDLSVKQKYQFDIESNGDTDVNYSNEYAGDYESWVRGYYKSIKDEEKVKNLQDMVNGISPGGKLLKYEFFNTDDISKPFWFTLNYKLFNYPIKAADLLIFRLPHFKLDFNEIGLESRKYPIEYNYPLGRTTIYTLNLPSNFEVQYIPPDIDWKSDYASYKTHSEIKGKTVVFTSAFKRYKRLVPTSDYKAYKELLNKISRYTEDRMFFKVTK